MPRFYFHVFNDVISLDVEGAELPDLEAARRYALYATRELVAEQVRAGRLNPRHYVEVTDERGEKVLRIAFGDSFTTEA